ncbi:MAG: hypothetical protein QOE28_2530 [Solirubrobacteraceae bacterium]|jgi:hypothetical protein|nr:hypothetical protein [Solirubrobacteraceae bacterium]
MTALSGAARSGARVRGLGGCAALELFLEPAQEAGLREALADLRHAHLDGLVEAARAGGDGDTGDGGALARHREALDAVAALETRAGEGRLAGPADLVAEVVRAAALTAAEALAAAVEPPLPSAPELRALAEAATAWTATLADCTEVAP